MPQIDRLEEVRASQLEIETGLSTITEETIQLNSENFKRNHEKREDGV